MESENPEPTQYRGLADGPSPLKRALWTMLVYLFVGLAWITFSDRVVEVWFTDRHALSVVQTWKGFLFVVLTALALFLTMLRLLTKDRTLLSLQLRQRRALAQRERQLTVLMNNLPGMAYRCQPDKYWTMLFVSAGCEPLTGYKPEELINNSLISYAGLMDDETAKRVDEVVSVAVRRDETFSVEYRITCKNGQKRWVWERGCAVEEDDGSICLEGIILDISDRKRLEDELEELATRDSLTGLFNRRELARCLDDELERASRYEHPMAVLWIDFDHFKDVNDNWGHAAGDTVLRTVSDLLKQSIRGIDVIGRFGGEEFVVILPEMDVDEAETTAERLRQQVAREPVALDNGHTVPITISIGVAVFPAHGCNSERLCAAADKAMYRAKAQGRNCVAVARMDD